MFKAHVRAIPRCGGILSFGWGSVQATGPRGLASLVPQDPHLSRSLPVLLLQWNSGLTDTPFFFRRGIAQEFQPGSHGRNPRSHSFHTSLGNGQGPKTRWTWQAGRSRVGKPRCILVGHLFCGAEGYPRRKPPFLFLWGGRSPKKDRAT